MIRQRLLACALIVLMATTSMFGRLTPPGKAEEIPQAPRLRLGSDRFRVPGYIAAASISPDGREIAVVNGGTQFSILSVETGRPVRSFVIGEHLRNNQVFHTPDGKRLVTAGYNGIHVWDALDGRKINSIPPADKDRRDGMICLSEDGKAVSVWTMYQNAFVKVMRLADGAELGTIKPLHNSTLHSTLSPDGSLAATWGQHYAQGQPKPEDLLIPRSVHIWDVKTAKLLMTLQTENTNITAVRFSPDGKRIATSGLGSIQLWETATAKLVRSMAGRSGSGQPASLVFSRDGKTLSHSAATGSVQTWETETGKRIGQCQAPIVAPASLQYRSDGTLLAWGVDSATLVLWEAPSGKFLTPPGGHRSPVVSLQFGANGKELNSISADGRMIRWETATGREIPADLRPNGSRPNGHSPVLFSPDGKYFIGGSIEGSGTAIWDATTNEELFALTGGYGLVDRGGVFAFSGDSKRVMAVARNNNREVPFGVNVWDVESSVPLNPLRGQKGDFTSAAFSPDGSALSTCSYSYSPQGGMIAEIWSRDVRLGKVLSKIQIPNQQIASVTYLDDRLFLPVNTQSPEQKIYDALTGQETRALDRAGDFPPTMHVVSPDRRLIGMVLRAAPRAPVAGFPSPDNRHRVVIWEVASGSIRQEFEMPEQPTAISFSRGNRSLAVGSGDTTISLFDLEKTPSDDPLKNVAIEDLWKTLADRPAPAARDAMRALIARTDEAPKLIKSRVAPSAIRKADPASIDKWIKDLDAPRYAVREAAMKELEKIATDAREPIRLALEKKDISPEMRERLEKLADLTSKPALETGTLRPLRAVEILERINNDGAREHLKALAGGGDSAVTRAARDALRRLEER